jgi:hypothetical protein
MIYRVKKNPKSLIVEPEKTLRAPGNIPFLVDNLWEWLRPADHASRRTAAFASPTPELAAAGANGSVEDAWGVELMEGQTAFQIKAGQNPADARHHEDIRRLHRVVVQEALGTKWWGLPASQRGPEAVLFLPCLSKEEVEEAIASSKLLNAERIRSASSFWEDVAPFDAAKPPPHPTGEIFFAGKYRLVPLKA